MLKICLFRWQKNHLFVMQPSPNDADYQAYADQVFSYPIHRFVRRFQNQEEKFGALAIPTSFGNVNRMWLDSVSECEFIRRHCPNVSKILEIGSGYGRLAFYAPHMLPIEQYLCVDPVPISAYLCEWYLQSNDSPSRVVFLDEVTSVRADLVINIHSWSECSVQQVESWLQLIDQIGCEYLFTKPHNDTFYCFNGGEFRSLLQCRFEIVAIEYMSLGKIPSVMWRRR